MEFVEVETGYFVPPQEEPLVKLVGDNLPSYEFKGVPAFFDVGGLCCNPESFSAAIDVLYSRYKNKDLTSICCVDARGFLFGPALALRLGIPFFMARKSGKLPGLVLETKYKTEYSEDSLSIPCNSVHPEDRVLIVDDLLGTGGTARAAVHLVRSSKGIPVEVAVVITIPSLRGWVGLVENNVSVFAIVESYSTPAMPSGSTSSAILSGGSKKHVAVLEAMTAGGPRGHVLQQVGEDRFAHVPLCLEKNSKYKPISS